MSNVQTVITAIQKMDNEELNRVVEALKLQRTFLSRKVTRSILIGDSVNFKAKGGRNVTGVVIKVNPKTLKVKTPSTVWTVTASLCTKVEAA